MTGVCIVGMMQQLVLASGSDEDMGSLFDLLHSASPTELQLKIDILKVMTLFGQIDSFCTVGHQISKQHDFFLYCKIFHN